MLTADALAALEAASPPALVRCPSDASSSLSSSLSSLSSSSSVTSPTTASAASPSGGGTVGKVRTQHAPGTTAAVDAAGKWIMAALRSLERPVTDLVSAETHEPDDALFSQVHTKLADWREAKVTARDAGVVDHRPHELSKTPPQCILAKARAWFIRHVNAERAKHLVAQVDDKWARNLANVKADARAVNADTRDEKAKDGTLFHHKHDLAPSHEELTTMCSVAFTGDARVSEDLLEAVEAGMAVAIYLPTGARGSELKKMHLQTISCERIQHDKSGFVFECLKLTAFECKTKDHHLNQFLPASNPWRCGVGALGVSILVRVSRDGPPPFVMELTANSWKVVHTAVGKGFDRRLNFVFDVAGVRRQSGDPLTYLGRHFGTRLLQHQGGSAEGGAARRGHTSGATFSYSECPLPDLHRLQGNNPEHPFQPAHHQESLHPYVDAVLLILFPALAAARDTLVKRHREVDMMRGEKSVKARTKEHLNDVNRILDGITLACRMALLCLVARPRTWKRWAIVEEALTMWQSARTNLVIQRLFANNVAAIEAMNTLAGQVRRCEESEIMARRASPEGAATHAVVSAVQQLSDRQVQREEELLRHQRDMFRTLMRQVSPPPTVGADTSSAASMPPPPPPPRPEQVATALMTPNDATASVVSQPLVGVCAKRKALEQHDVAHFSSHPTLTLALEYARDVLAPRERSDGAAWRLRKFPDGRKDASRHRQWQFYKRLAVAVGAVMKEGAVDMTSALTIVEGRRATFPSLTAFNTVMEQEQKTMVGDVVDEIAKRVLGY